MTTTDLAQITRDDCVAHETAKPGDFVLSGSGRSARIYRVERVETNAWGEGKRALVGRRVIKATNKLSGNAYMLMG